MKYKCKSLYNKYKIINKNKIQYQIDINKCKVNNTLISVDNEQRVNQWNCAFEHTIGQGIRVYKVQKYKKE